MQNFIAFKAEVKKQLALREWTHADLAKVAGCSKGTIDSFMCGVRCSERLAKAIADALDIPEHIAT